MSAASPSNSAAHRSPLRAVARDIAVRGGVMRVAEWAPQSPVGTNGMPAPVVLALHALDGAHPAWGWLVDQLPEARIVAPDLRGRGMSADLPAPFGVDQHVADILAVMDALGLSEVTVVGHSLGAFVAVAAAAARPDRFAGAVLVDGGLPLTVPLALHPDDLVELVCGRPTSRVDFAFTSRESHRRFWQLHPALAKDWSPRLAEYADYLLDERLAADGSIEYRPISSSEAVDRDAAELSGTVVIRQRLSEVVCPVTVLTAPRDLCNQVPGIYSPRERGLVAADFPTLRLVEAARVNHYTVVASERGASAVAHELRWLFDSGAARLQAT